MYPWSELVLREIPSQLVGGYLVCLSTWAFKVKDRSVSLDIANVEELCVFETIFSTSGDVRFHVV